MTTQQGSSAGGELKRFGWQGIQLTIPADWELVATQGRYESGYVALADNEAVRLQLRWDSGHGSADPSTAAERYIRLIQKSARRRGKTAKVGRGLNLASLKGKKLECYCWEADSAGLAMVSCCQECGRIVHIVLPGPVGEPPRRLARTVFASLRDHPEDGQVFWKFFDLEFSSPADMPLRRHGLQTGCIRMAFAARHEELTIERLSLAQLLLERSPLRQWLEQAHLSALKHWRLEVSQTQLGAHAGLRVRARPPITANPGRLIGRPRELRFACWHCADSNRLFVVRHEAPCGRPEVLERVVKGVKCCPQ